MARNSVASGLEFAPEVLYVQKGLKYGDSDASSLVFRLSYVELPLLFRKAFSDGNTRPFLTAGPVIGIKVDCKTTETNLGDVATEPCDESGGELKDVDYGVMFGGGVMLQRLSLSVRYNMGLVDINNGDFGGGAKNRVLMLIAGISF